MSYTRQQNEAMIAYATEGLPPAAKVNTENVIEELTSQVNRSEATLKATTRKLRSLADYLDQTVDQGNQHLSTGSFGDYAEELTRAAGQRQVALEALKLITHGYVEEQPRVSEADWRKLAGREQEKPPASLAQRLHDWSSSGGGTQKV